MSGFAASGGPGKTFTQVHAELAIRDNGSAEKVRTVADTAGTCSVCDAYGETVCCGGPKTGNAIIDQWPARFGDKKGPYAESCGYPGCSYCDNDGSEFKSDGPVASSPPDRGSPIATVLPVESGARKEIPIVSGVLDYFPNAVAYVAMISKKGNDKHNPGQPLHWSVNKSNDHAECIGRHLVDRGTIDPTDGMRHSGMLAWRALAHLEEELVAAGAPRGRGAYES